MLVQVVFMVAQKILRLMKKTQQYILYNFTQQQKDLMN